jgi:hypothetical protein
MSEDIWYGKRKAGHIGAINENEILLYEGAPDYVTLPSELGSRRMKVISAFISKCPKCDAQVRHLELGDNYYVAECLVHKFLWYSRKVK